MAKLVYVTSGRTGVLNSAIEIARRLTAAGHVVVFVGRPELAEAITANGFAHVGLDDDVRMLEAVDGPAWRRFPDWIRLRRAIVRSTELDDAIRAERPDALIIDIEMHYAILATRRSSIPTIVRFEWFSIYRDWAVPPMHTALGLPTGLGARWRVRFAWIELIVRRALANTLGRIRPTELSRRLRPFRYGTVSRQALVDVARAHGLRLRDETSWTHWLAPHVYPTLPSMTTTAVEMDFVHAMPAGHHYVGPMIRRDRVDPRVTDADRARWEAFRVDQTRRGRPLVYCSVGTLSERTVAIVGNVIAAVRDREVALVAGLGGTAHRSALGDPADNVLVMDYAPQIDVLGASATALIHGGINTINECVASAVPMIVDRDGAIDQPGCAARVEHHRLGQRVDLERLPPAELGALIERTIDDAELATRLRAMRATCAAYEADGVLELVIDDLAQERLVMPTTRRTARRTRRVLRNTSRLR